eukprot:5757211-Pleurochrysis_carterae.AAC.1
MRSARLRSASVSSADHARVEPVLGWVVEMGIKVNNLLLSSSVQRLLQECNCLASIPERQWLVRWLAVSAKELQAQVALGHRRLGTVHLHTKPRKAELPLHIARYNSSYAPR